MTGTGTVSAEGGSPAQKRKGGGGGRISIQLEDEDLDYAAFKSGFTGVLQARGGYPSNNGTYERTSGAAGTIYVETAADSGKGHMLLLNGNWAGGKGTTNFRAQTPVSDGVTWNLSSLDMKINGRVLVASGGVLHLSSFGSITGDSSTEAAICFSGGSVTSDIKHDRLVADRFAVESAGTSSFADHTLVIPDDSSLKVSGDFTVGALVMGHIRIEAGDYSAAALAETYDNLSGGGTIHVLGLVDALTVIIR